MKMLHGNKIKNKISSMTGDSAGFSLIEIIVVVLIISIAAGAATMSLTAALRANTTRAATELSAVMSEARMESMARPAGHVELQIRKDGGDGRFYADIVLLNDSNGTEKVKKVIESKAIASGAVTLSACDSGNGTGAKTDINKDNSAVITFSKSSGRLNTFKVGNGNGYDTVVISGAKTSTVRIAKMTGRSYVE